ncbi:MAG: zinc ribbon domain-containing protein [Planctomycetota bacterium]|nr:zinc ribbon domain-containing protein [Planctomycetota bacterium]
MPTYDYVCNACEHAFHAFHAMSDDPLKKCPECGKDSLRRLIGAGAGIIFKGSGFYETDYKRARKSQTKSDDGGSEPKKTEKKDSGDSKKEQKSSDDS